MAGSEEIGFFVPHLIEKSPTENVIVLVKLEKFQANKKINELTSSVLFGLIRLSDTLCDNLNIIVLYFPHLSTNKVHTRLMSLYRFYTPSCTVHSILTPIIDFYPHGIFP